MKILIFGASGSGTTTLGEKLKKGRVLSIWTLTTTIEKKPNHFFRKKYL